MRARNSYLLALLSGILLLLSYPPFNLEFLAWFAFVPVLIAIYYETKAKRRGRLKQVVTICVIPISLWLCSFLGNFLPMVAAWPLGVILAFLLAGQVIDPVKENGMSQQLPRQDFSYLPSGWQIFLLPIIVTAGEFLLMNIPVVMKVFGAIGFFSVSRTQWLNPPILQLASFTGMYGVTFLVWLVNSALAYGIVYYKETKRISKQAVTALLVFIIIFVCGWISLPGVTTGDTTVVIIKVKPSTMEREQVNELYANLSERSLKYEPEIILWPIWVKREGGGRQQYVGPFADQYVSFSQKNDVYLSNGMVTVLPDGRILDHYLAYHLTHAFDGLVPFDLDKILPEPPGIHVRSGKFDLLACMETAYTVPARQCVKGGTRFLAGWSGDSTVTGAFPGLLGGNMVYRAVENRIYTALFHRDDGCILVDPYGRIMEDIAPEPEIVAGKVAFTDERSFYSKYGDIFSFIVVALWATLVGYNLYLKRRSPYFFCKRCRTQIEKGTKVCPVCGKKRR